MALPYLQPGSASWPPISDAPERVGQSNDVLAKDRIGHSPHREPSPKCRHTSVGTTRDVVAVPKYCYKRNDDHERSCPGSGGKEKWHILPVGEVHDQHTACQGGDRRNAPWARVSASRSERMSLNPSR